MTPTAPITRERADRVPGTTGGAVDALVTDAQSRAAVAGVRALGRAGLSALALGPGRGGPALWSRYAARRATGPGTDEPAGFVSRIGELAREHGPLVVFPAQEEALDPLSEHRGELPREAILPLPGADALRAVSDKSRLAALAPDAGPEPPPA